MFLQNDITILEAIIVDIIPMSVWNSLPDLFSTFPRLELLFVIDFCCFGRVSLM